MLPVVVVIVGLVGHRGRGAHPTASPTPLVLQRNAKAREVVAVAADAAHLSRRAEHGRDAWRQLRPLDAAAHAAAWLAGMIARHSRDARHVGSTAIAAADGPVHVFAVEHGVACRHKSAIL